MEFNRVPCHRCPQHSKFFNVDETTKATVLVHVCKENWYAEMETVDSTPREADDSLAQLNREQLLAFWNKLRHRIFSCPYRREKFVYKALPLVLSSLALIISALNNETVKSFLGFAAKDPKPMKLEQPIQVTLQADPLKAAQPLNVIPQAESSTDQKRSDNSNANSGSKSENMQQTTPLGRKNSNARK